MKIRIILIDHDGLTFSGDYDIEQVDYYNHALPNVITYTRNNNTSRTYKLVANSAVPMYREM